MNTDRFKNHLISFMMRNYKITILLNTFCKCFRDTGIQRYIFKRDAVHVLSRKYWKFELQRLLFSDTSPKPFLFFSDIFPYIFSDLKY